jgi:hypothetical protein
MWPLPNLNFNQRQRLVESMLACSCMSNPDSRDQVVLDLPDEARPRIKRFPDDLRDVNSIVRACLEFEGAVQRLFKVVHFHEGDSVHWRRLELLISELEQGIDPIDPASHAHRLHHRCNRSPQRDSFEMAFDLHQESRARRPFVCLVHGDESECHDLMLDRLQHEILPGLLDVSVNDCVWSEPPSPKDSVDKFWIALGKRLLNKRFNTTAESQEQILKELERLGRPLLVRLQWYSEQFGQWQANGLDNFMRFWESWPALPENRQVICALSLVYSNAKDASSRLMFWRKSPTYRLKEWVKEYEKGAQPAPSFSLSVLPELELVEHHEAKRWCDYLDPERREQVKDQVIDFFKGRNNRPIDMRTLVKELKTYLDQTKPSAQSLNRR